MGKFLSRALRGASKVLERGVESADNIIDGPVTDRIKHVTDSGKNTVNRVSESVHHKTVTDAAPEVNEESTEESHTVQEPQSPLYMLKIKFVNGEITQEEYQMKKRILES